MSKASEALGLAIRKYAYSAYEHYTFTELDDPACYVRVGPNHEDIEFWYWSAGQEGDLCIECGRDISDDSEILLNQDSACFVLMCFYTDCWDRYKAREIAKRKGSVAICFGEGRGHW